MNERIKELSRLAQTFANANCEDEFGSVDESKRKNVFQEKFAELIVRECARVAIQKQTENDMDNIVSKNPAKDFAYALIEHFGVEE